MRLLKNDYDLVFINLETGFIIGKLTYDDDTDIYWYRNINNSIIKKDTEYKRYNL